MWAAPPRLVGGRGLGGGKLRPAVRTTSTHWSVALALGEFLHWPPLTITTWPTIGQSNSSSCDAPERGNFWTDHHWLSLVSWPIVESRPLKIFWYTSVRESSDHISPVIGGRSVWRGSFTSHMTIWCWKNSNGPKRCNYQVVDFSNVELKSWDEHQNVSMSLKYPPLLILFCLCFTSFHPVT